MTWLPGAKRKATERTGGRMSGINRFLSRREKRSSGSQQKKVKFPSLPSSSSSPSLLSVPAPAPLLHVLSEVAPKLLLPPPSMPESESETVASSSSHSGTSTPLSLPRSWSSSLSSVSLAFPGPAGKCSPLSRLITSMVQSSTADSVDLVLQPRLIIGDDLYACFTPEDGRKSAKDEEKKV